MRAQALVLWLCVAWFSAHGQMAPAARPAHPVFLQQATDIISRWQPGQHLYVKGKVGASEESLAGLEQWLEQRAPNWVVLLAENAEGETYTDAEGRTYSGVEAVNHAMGKGLMNQTVFGQQTDPRTQERNAAFFILCLKEHHLGYYASEAQNRRGLGIEHWPGNLDAPAVSAMRNGARVVDAAKDTISSINRKLDASIVAEIENRKQRAAAELAEKNRAMEQAKAALETAQADYSLLEGKSGELARQSAGLTGDLARPDLAALRAELQTGRTALAQNDPARARRAGDSVHQRVQALLPLLDQYGPDRKKLDELTGRLRQEQARPLARAAASQVQAAKDAVERARLEYERGDSAYRHSLETAAAAVWGTANAISAAERLAAQRQMLLLLGLFSLLSGIAVVALLLNRRRLPAKTEAKQLYALWDKALGEKTIALFNLLDRRGNVVGASADEAAQRYSGETLRLSQQVIQDVDELFIMSSCAGRILQEAGALLEPAVVWPRLGNLFFASRYRRTIGLLRDHPIAFRPEEGLELVVRGTRTERDRLIGELASYQPFTMSFNDLVAAFNQRAERALSALEAVSSSLMTAPDILRGAQEAIEQTRAREPEITKAEDGLFCLHPVFAQLLPAARAALAAAVKTAISDPVGAMQTDGARAKQQSDDAGALVKIATATRQTTIPLVRECQAALVKSGLQGDWLQQALKKFSEQADAAVARALEGSAAAEIGALSAALADLEKRGKRALELDQARREQAEPQIARSIALIDKAREEIGRGLGLPADKALRESGNDPSEFVTQAQSQLAAGVSALNRGDLDAAANALRAVESITSQANAIVAASQEAFARHTETLAALRDEEQKVAALVPEHTRVLAEIQKGYAPSVLSLGAGDATHPNANGTIGDNIEETEAHLAAVRGLFDRAVALHRQAGVLEAADLLRQAKARLEAARHRLAEIMEKKARLVQTEAGNAELVKQLDQRAGECARLAEASTTMVPTVQAFEAARQALEDARAAVQAATPDPFGAADKLSAVKQGLDSVADQARCDKDVYEQAGRSLTAAASQLAKARSIADQAASDRVPDSPAIQQARAEVQNLETRLGAAKEAYLRPHGEWHTVDHEVNTISSGAAKAAATLRGELERAQAAVAALSTAAGTVRNAGAWTGGFGVIIFGTPGSDLLSQARAYLEIGDYNLARRVAENARAVAAQAIAQAEAEVVRRRLAEQARIEAERRRRQAEEMMRQQQQSSSIFSSGSSSSSSSWGSSGSGVSSSTFSSGSGVGSSSW